MMAGPETPRQSTEEVPHDSALEKAQEDLRPVDEEKTEEKTEENSLSKEEIKAALRGEGPLAPLHGIVLEHARGREDEGFLLSDDRLRQIIAALKEKEPQNKAFAPEHKKILENIARRLYALNVWDAVKAKRRDYYEKLEPAEKKKIEAFEKDLRNASIENVSVDELVARHGFDTKTAESQVEVGAFLGMVKNLESLRSKDPRRLAQDVHEYLSRRLPGGTPRGKSRRETALNVSDGLRDTINHLNDSGGNSSLKRLSKYAFSRWWNPQTTLARTGGGRTLEGATTLMETGSLVSASSFIASAALGLELTITPGANPLLWAGAGGAMFVTVALPAYLFKATLEEELSRNKGFLTAVGKTAVRRPVSGVMAAVSMAAMYGALVRGELNVERSEDIAELVQQRSAAIEEEFSRIETQEQGVAKAKRFFQRLLSHIPYLGEEKALGSSEYPLLDQAVNVPTEFRRRMEIAVQAEAGNQIAQGEADKWGIPRSSYAGLGKRALSLALLAGMSTHEAELLADDDAPTEQMNSAALAKAQKQLIAFAKEQKLELAGEDMTNPQRILEALVARFGDETADLFEEFSEKRSSFNDALKTQSILAAMISVFRGELPPDPKEISYRQKQLENVGYEIEEKYNEFAKQVEHVTSAIVAQGIKNIYQENGEGGNIDPNKIAIAPESIDVDFTNVRELAKDIQAAMKNMPRDDEPQATPDIATLEEQVTDDLSNIEKRLERIANFIDPSDEIAEIVQRRYGPEAEQYWMYYGFEATKDALAVLSIEFIAILTILGGAARKVGRAERKHGAKQRERIRRAEDVIVKKFAESINAQIKQYREFVRTKQKEDDIRLVFPFDDVSEADVRRAIRAVGTKDFVNQSFVGKLVARGPYQVNLDTSNRYSDALYALKTPKMASAVIDELLPGWGLALKYIDRFDKDMTKQAKRKGKPDSSRWHRVRDITAEKDVRALEIAILTEQNRRAEATVEMHELLLERLRKEFSGVDADDGTLEIRPHELKKNEGKLNLYPNEWKQLISAVRSGAPLDQIRDRITLEKRKIEQRTNRIANLYKELETSPVFELSDQFKKKLGKSVPPSIVIATPDFMRKRIENLITEGEKGANDTLPFQAIDAIVGDIVKSYKQGTKDIKSTAVGQKTVENAEAQMNVIVSGVLEKANKAFSKALPEPYRLESRMPIAEGLELALSVRNQESGEIIAEESVRLNQTLARGLKGVSAGAENALGKQLLGDETWKRMKEGEFAYRPGRGSDTELMNAYHDLWQAYEKDAVANSKGVDKSEATALINERIKSSITADISGKNLSKEEALNNASQGFVEYLRHRQALRAQQQLRKGEDPEVIKSMLTENEKGAASLTGHDNVRLDDLRSAIETIYADEEARKAGIRFDFLKQQFVQKGITALFGSKRTMTWPEFRQRIVNPAGKSAA